MSQFDDLPVIQCKPTPSDDELAAQRDERHRIEVAEYWRRQGFHDDWPVGEVVG